MFIYLKLAIRNVHKNIRSLSLNGIGIALTVIVILFILSFSRGIENQIVLRNIQFETGGIVIHLEKEMAGWENRQQNERTYNRMIKMLEASPSVKGYRKRISVGNALLYGSDGTQRIRIEGMEKNENKLLNEMLLLTEGDTDWEKVPEGILLSNELAEEAGLSLSDECRIVLPTIDGSINMQDFIVTGIFRNTSQANKNKIYMEYGQAKELYYSNLPIRLLIDLTRLEEAEELSSLLSMEFPSTDIEIKTYLDYIGSARALSDINRKGMSGMAFFLLFISFVGIWAMVVEQVHDRRKETGTLLTFGFSRKGVKKIFLLESLYTSILFGMAGLLIAGVIFGGIALFDGVYLGRLASFAFGSATVLPQLEFSDMFLAGGIALAYPFLATWLSLRTLNRVSVINLLNSSY